ncbi:MAG: NAD(P)/FAD-dependent oxidoreductase [Pseudomonadota bacterium]
MAVSRSPSSHVDAAFLRRALDQADVNALRLALYQHTADEELAQMPVSSALRPGNPFRFTRLSKDHHQAVKDKAFAFVTGGGSPLRTPARAEADALMDLFCGRPLSAADRDYAWGDLGFDPLARAPQWRNRPSQAVLDGIDITVVGAGFGGLLAAIQLERLGLRCRIVERQSGIGGTWWLNTYPEARVDVTSFLYQYKFELDYPWGNHFPTQGDLLRYFDYIVDKYQLRERITLDTEVTDARWDERAQRWQIRTRSADGRTASYESHFMISASGQFSTPQLPRIDGIDDFQGALFHSTGWDHDFDLTGKRVAVVGTGSTGTQMVRGLAKQAAALTVYQRTPNWITRMPNYRQDVTAEQQWLLDHFPGYRNWYVFSAHIAQMRMDGINEVDRDWVAAGGLFNERNDQLREMLKAYILDAVGGDQHLYEQLVPDYAPLARRPVVDNNFYHTLTQPHVALVSGQVQAFTGTGVVGGDGVERAHDLVVLCAGFEVERFLYPTNYRGRDGASLNDLWQADGPRAYLTAMLPGFPNFAMMYGPNSGLVAGSYHSWVELFSCYYCQVIVDTIERGAGCFEVTRAAYEDFNQELDARAQDWVFQYEDTGGGYYKNAHGRSAVRLPWRVPEFYERIAQPDRDHFEFRGIGDWSEQ